MGKPERSFADSMPGGLKKGLVMCHEFNDTQDSSGAGSHITELHTTEGPPPELGDAAKFDIIRKQYAVVPPNQHLASLSQAFTLACWFREIPFEGNDNLAYNQGLVVSGGIGLYIGKGAQNRVFYGFCHMGGLNYAFIDNTRPSIDDRWHFCGMSFASGKARISWYDDVIYSSPNMISSSFGGVRQNLTIGVLNPALSNNGNFWNGYVALPMIWSRNLSVREISRIYAMTRDMGFSVL
jgi:hypothetical protein